MFDQIFLFHKLPYHLKLVVAGMRGWSLSRLRYGAETRQLIEDAVLRESWTQSEWDNWMSDRLGKILEIARFSVPWYRDWWEEHQGGFGPDSWRELTHWPIVNKELIRAKPRAFVRDRVRITRLFHTHTSGSTGTPLELWVDRKGLRSWYALFEARWRRWNGVNRWDRWAIIGGQRVVESSRRRPPFWVWNSPMRQLYISAYHVAGWSAVPIIAAMRKAKIRYVFGYASALTELAREIVEQRLEAPAVRVVISNAEPLSSSQRRLIGHAFRSRVVNTYGMSEMVAGASECEHGNLHLWPEAGVVEVLDDDGCPVENGTVGRLVCTGLLNNAMPLIRYEIGDRGALATPNEDCPCGRTLPILTTVEGRLDDLVVTPDGRKIGRLDTVFKTSFPIRRAQIIQENLTNLRVRVEKAGGYGAGTRELIAAAVRDRVGGSMEIHVEEIDEIPLGPNGKFRGVVSKISRRSIV